MNFRVPRGLLAALALSGCAYEVAFDPDYVSEEAPSFIAEAQIQIVLPAAERSFVFEGRPTTETGDFTTLTIPMGSIMQEITGEVFESCFMYGVTFSDRLDTGADYVVAIEPHIQAFSYGYNRVVENPFSEPPEATITPQVEFGLDLKVYDRAGRTVLEKLYESGLVSGESYIVTARPQERINETFHAALQEIMLTAAEDIRPFLVGQCEITDLEGQVG